MTIVLTESQQLSLARSSINNAARSAEVVAEAVKTGQRNGSQVLIPAQDASVAADSIRFVKEVLGGSVTWVAPSDRSASA